MKDQVLAGQKAIITGGTAGIGKAIAHRFAQEGAKVILLGTNPERGNQAVTEINSAIGQEVATFHPVNVANFADVTTLFSSLANDLGGIDILVNNAGITKDNLLMKITEEDWDTVLDVNLKACFNTCKALVRPFIKARKGKIINVSSVVAITGNPGQANYCASKAGMIGLTKSLAKELAPRNICVNCIAPGFIETSMTEKLSPQQKEGILGNIPLGRIGSAEEVAEAALFLATPASNYVTGQVLVVDGGMAM